MNTDPNEKPLNERVMELLEDADNPEVSNEEYERRRKELEKEQHEHNEIMHYDD